MRYATLTHPTITVAQTYLFFSFDSDHFGTSTKIFSRFGGMGIERP